MPEEENPFSVASLSSLYADDDSIAERRRAFAELRRVLYPSAYPPAKGVCNFTRRCNIIAVIVLGVAVVVVALALGLGLGLGLQRSAAAEGEGDDGGDTVKKTGFEVESVRTYVVAADAGATFLSSGVLALYESMADPKRVDTRLQSPKYTIAFLPSDAGNASVTACAADCPVFRDANGTDNAKAHASRAAVACFNANFDSSAATVMAASDYAPFSADVRELRWPGNPDNLYAWRGYRYQRMLMGAKQGMATFHVCSATGSTDVVGVSEQTLYKQATELFNNSWYRDVLDNDMLSTTGEDGSFDGYVDLSANYVAFDGGGGTPCGLQEVPADSRVRLWAPVPQRPVYNFTYFADSVAITVVDTVMNQLLTGLVVVCRCPTGSLHRFFSVDILFLAVSDYHECLLAGITYHLSDAANTTNGHPIVREYMAPTLIFGISTTNSSDVAKGKATCEKQSQHAQLLRCAFVSKTSKAATEGVAPAAEDCSHFTLP